MTLVNQNNRVVTEDFEDGFRYGVHWERRRRSLRESAMNYKRKKNYGKYTIAMKKYNRHLTGPIELSDAYTYDIKNYKEL